MLKSVRCSTVLTVLILLPNYSKFAVECDWNGKISQNVRKLLFKKKSMDSSRENLIFFLKIDKVVIFAVEYVSSDITSEKNVFFHLNWGFCAEIKKILKFEKLSKIAENYFFREKVYIFLNGIFSKVRGQIKCGWWPCLFLFSISKKRIKRMSGWCTAVTEMLL